MQAVSAPLPSPSSAFAHTRAEIARLDREASLLRNRAQIPQATRARIDALARQSAYLSAALPETKAAQARRAAETETKRAEFARGHGVFQRVQAPALSSAEKALRALLSCTLPPQLERAITGLIADLDCHANDMTDFAPSQGLPPAMERLIRAHSFQSPASASLPLGYKPYEKSLSTVNYNP